MGEEIKESLAEKTFRVQMMIAERTKLSKDIYNLEEEIQKELGELLCTKMKS